MCTLVQAQAVYTKSKTTNNNSQLYQDSPSRRRSKTRGANSYKKILEKVLYVLRSSNFFLVLILNGDPSRFNFFPHSHRNISRLKIDPENLIHSLHGTVIKKSLISFHFNWRENNYVTWQFIVVFSLYSIFLEKKSRKSTAPFSRVSSYYQCSLLYIW